jgi:hypothetical protein
VSELWHVSDDGSIERFEPRADAAHDSPQPLLWAIDAAHLPAYWFPRECPRATFWAVDSTTDEDVERFLTGDRKRRVHAIESAWLAALRSARLFAYRLPQATFERYGRAAGYAVSRVASNRSRWSSSATCSRGTPRPNIELRVVPDLAGLRERVVATTLEFSGIRLRNL